LIAWLVSNLKRAVGKKIKVNQANQPISAISDMAQLPQF
jgi:hypothetical protein